MAHRKTQMQQAFEKHLKEMAQQEEEARGQTRLVRKMKHDEGMSALERGYSNCDEVCGDRERAFQGVQRFSKNLSRNW